ncbi:MAG: glycosyltransferase family 9 protein [Ignavibacteria bacterium]|nr:glycosyltransferase family 9 protein [Ignavibacteria bacterium]
MIHNLKRTELLSIPNKFPIVKKIIEKLFSIILFSFRKVTPKRKNGNNVILSFHRLGDTVFTIPALKGLFSKFGENNFILFCFPENKVIYQKVFPQLKIITFDLSDFLFEGRCAKRKLRKIFSNQKPYDVIDITGTLTSVSLFIGQKINRVIGLSDDILISAYDRYSLKTNVQHLTDLYINCINLYKDMNSYKYDKEFPQNYITTGRILIHPFAGWEAKEWGIQNFIELAKELKTGFAVEFVFPLDDKNSELKELLNSVGIPYNETKSIEDFIDLNEEMSLLISNDSGPVHISSLLGKPTFTIYGPTNPITHVPYGKIHSYIRKEIHCSPLNTKYCYTRGGEFCDSYECMKNLSVSEVYQSVKQFTDQLGLISKIVL